MAVTFRYDSSTAVVGTTRGTVRGYELGGLSIFKGIPYAKAKRFHRPEPYRWEGVLDATSYGFTCPLMDMGVPNGEIMVPHRYWIMNEDCQNLNIWTPGLDDKKRPVMVWLHGGGYFAGSSIEQWAYEGENMARLGDVVVVSINHRLNVIGYLDLSDFGEEYVNSGNAGGDDIIEALRFVKENIEKFGGDPDNVTVFGQSGGGGKVTTLLQSPEADGLYHKGINMSGVLSGGRGIGISISDCKGSGKECVLALMKELGVSSAAELESVPYAQLAAAYQKVSPALAKEGKNIGGSPFRNEFYVGDPCDVGFRKETIDIPLLVGTVYGEFTSFVPADYDRNAMSEKEQEAYVEEVLGKEGAGEVIPLFKKAFPMRQTIDLLRLDYTFRDNVIAYNERRAREGGKVYSYLFNHDMPMNGGSTPWHCSDIPYVFHNSQFAPATQEPGVTEVLEETIFRTVIAFAKNGDPNNSLIPNWPACTPQTENTMMIDSTWSLHPDHDHELMPVFIKYMQPVFLKRMAETMGSVQH